MASILKASRGKGYYSKHLLAESVVAFYSKNKLWPQGLDEKLPAIQEWPMKMGEGLARLEPCCNMSVCLNAKAGRFRHLARRSSTSKKKQLSWIREEIRGCVAAWLQCVMCSGFFLGPEGHARGCWEDRSSCR